MVYWKVGVSERPITMLDRAPLNRSTDTSFRRYSRSLKNNETSSACPLPALGCEGAAGCGGLCHPAAVMGLFFVMKGWIQKKFKRCKKNCGRLNGQKSQLLSQCYTACHFFLLPKITNYSLTVWINLQNGFSCQTTAIYRCESVKSCRQNSQNSLFSFQILNTKQIQTLQTVKMSPIHSREGVYVNLRKLMKHYFGYLFWFLHLLCY